MRHINIADALQNAATDAADELAKPVRKRLSSLGHLIGRFAEACDQLRKSAEKFPALKPWLQGFADASTCALSGSGWFCLALSTDAEGKPRLEKYIAEHKVIAPHVEAWNRMHPDKQIFLDSAIKAPSSFCASVWPALLRLRPLHDFWERALRRDGMEMLMQTLPDAWLLDPAPLPPGAVIPRLEIPSWASWNLVTAAFPSLIFTCSPAAADQPAPIRTDADIHLALSHFPSAPQILTAHHSATGPLLISFYHKKESRTDWLGALAFTLHDKQS